MEAKDRSGPVPLSVTARLQSWSPTSVHNINMTSYFADDSQSTNSADFGFASSNSSRIWSSSGIASNTNATVNASANGTDAKTANNMNNNVNVNMNNNVNINHNANLSSTRDRDKHGLTLNRSNSTTTTTGSGSPYYPSGLFSTFNSHSHSSNIDNNAHDSTVSNSGIGVSDVLDMNIRTMSGSVSIPASPNENINSTTTTNTQHSNSHSHSNSHTHSSSIDRFATGKFSSQSSASASASASALTSLNLDNHHNLTPGSVSASLNHNVNTNVNASLNSNHLSKSSFGPQGFMPGPLPGPNPSSGPSSSPPASSSASAPGPASSSNPNSSRGGHAQPQLQPRQVDHSSYEYMQHSLGPHSQIQPRQHQHQHQHHPDPLSNVMQGMHISGNPSHGHSHGPMHMSAMGMDPLEDVLGTFPCIRMRNLPYDANLQDVLILFQGLIILDVVVMPASSPYTSTQHNHQHNPTGEAFVLFANPMDFQMALQRSGLQMRHGGAQIEIVQGKRGDYYAAISSVHARLMHGEDRRSDHGHHQQHQQHQHQQHLQGGPGPGPGQGPLLSQSLWQGGPGHAHAGTMGIHQNQTAGVGVGLPSHGHPHGHALGHASNNPHRDNNYKTNPSPPLGAGHGGSMPSTMKSHRGGRSEGRKGSGGRGSGRGGGIQVGEHTGYLRMRGLPFTSTKKEIFDFFKAYEPVEDSICLTYRSDGRATGEGYILFSTPDNAKKAMALHRNSMGSRYIELFISNKDEHGRAQAREPTSEE